MDFKPPYTAQGDLNIFSVPAIPRSAKERAPEKDGNHILAHSETGHHHVIDGNCVRVFQNDEFESFIEVKKSAEIIHLRGFDTHAPIKLPEGKYRITRQREYIPGGYRLAAD